MTSVPEGGRRCGRQNRQQNAQDQPLDRWAHLCHPPTMLGEAERQFSLTRVALIAYWRAKGNFLSANK